MLRNMHLSQVRRAARLRENSSALLQLSLVDHDSAEIGLRAVEERALGQARHELLRICLYACLRKETSKAGSVLILRFFHGYRPREIARVLRAPRGAVDEFLSVARSEARAFVADPNSLAFLAAGKSPASPAAEEPRAEIHEDLAGELRRLIFATPEGVCPYPSQLRSLYQGPLDRGPHAALLAHMVGCRSCLDEVNKLLDLPPLAARDLMTALGRERRQRGKGGRGGGPADPPPAPPAGGGFVERYRRRLRETFGHRPKELRVSVNGFVLGSHSINAGRSRQTITINLDEKIGFVEVFSEEEVRLLFAVVEPPPEGPAERRERVSLSGGRTLELTLSFGESRPRVDVVYHDPLFHADPAARPVSSEVGDAALLPPDDSAAPGGGVRDLLRRLLRHVGGRGFWLRPGTVTAVFAAILIAALVASRLPGRRESAVDLLRQSAAAEEAAAGDRGSVRHRVIDLEERRAATGELVSRRRIEVWQSAAHAVTARRLYDEHGRLLAGEWDAADGTRTVYRRGARPEKRPAGPRDADSLPSLEDVWTLEPSAKIFEALVGRADASSVEDRADSYLINYRGGSPAAPGRLAGASLVIDRAGLRPTQLSLVVRVEGEAREYRFREASLERRPAADVPPSVFEPDRELVGATTARGTPSPPTPTYAASEVSAPAAPANLVAPAQLEVDVLDLLGGIGADLGQEVIVTRTPAGPLRVEGVVGTQGRKAEILRALAPVAHDPAVEIRIETVEEAQERSLREQSSAKGRQSAVTSESVVTQDSIPVQAEVRRYLLGRGVPEQQVELEIGRLSNQALMMSHQAMLHVWALKSLVSRFTPEDLRSLQPEARAKWLGLVRAHALGYRKEVASLRQQLAPVFDAPQQRTPPSPEQVRIADDASLINAVSALVELASANHEAVRSAFTVSAGAGQNSPIRSPQFWGRLDEAETVAVRIAAATEKSREHTGADGRR